MTDDRIDRKLAEWAAEGLLSDAQAAAIRDREARAAGGPRGAGIPIVTEILGYVGGALAVGAVFTLMAAWWNDLGALGHVGLPGLVAVTSLASGFLVGRAGSASARRLEQFLLALGVAAVGCAAGVGVHDACCAAHTPDAATAEHFAWSNFTGFAAAAAVGAAVFRARPAALQHIACGVPLAGLCLAIGPVAPDWMPRWLPGALLAALSLAWGAMSERGRLRPAGVGLALASVGLLVGILNAGDGPDPGLPDGTVLAALLASLGLIGVSLRLRRGVLLGFGAAGVVVFGPWLLSVVFGKTIGVPIAALLTGVVLVATAVAVAYVLPKVRRR